MKKTLKSVMVAALGGMVLAQSAIALTLTVDRLAGYYDTSFIGGEFTIYGTPYNSLYAPEALAQKTVNDPIGFQTFCLEYTEQMPINKPLDYVVSDKAIWGGVGPAGDVISEGTAWLYSHFASGILDDDGYNYTPGAGRAATAQALQETIWWLEGEQPDPVNAFSALVSAHFGGDANAMADNTGTDVAVLNLTQTDDTGRVIRRQDVLVYIPRDGKEVPDGGLTALLFGASLMGCAALRRRLTK